MQAESIGKLVDPPASVRAPGYQRSLQQPTEAFWQAGLFEKRIAHDRSGLFNCPAAKNLRQFGTHNSLEPDYQSLISMKSADSKTTVLLTGATGYLGGRIIARQEPAGYRVRGLVRGERKLRTDPSQPAYSVQRGDRVSTPRLRLGLCCAFRGAPIRFRTTTAAAMLRRAREEQLRLLSEIARQNAASLRSAVMYCAASGFGCFRVMSHILPLRTHPTVGYAVADLPDAESIVAAFTECGRLARKLDVRLTFHPDQFVVLNSPDARIVRNSIAELEYQAEVADWIGADVVTIHGGGAYGDKQAAVERLRSTLGTLPNAVRSRIALENDDSVFSPRDLLPLCESQRVPFVYDVHHHRCLPDELQVEEVTRRAVQTWASEPLFHISSPAGGWRVADPRVHADFIALRDFPREWRDLAITVEVEARAKETAVSRLKRGLSTLDRVAVVPDSTQDQPAGSQRTTVDQRLRTLHRKSRSFSQKGKR